MNRVLALQKLASNSSLATSNVSFGSEELFLISSISGVCGTGLGKAAQN